MATGDVDAKITTTRAFNANVFDGVDDYVEIPHNAAQLGANLSNGFTISAWINPRSIGETNGRIIDKSTGSVGTGGFGVYCASSNKIGVKLNNGTEHVTASDASPYGSWVHFILTISSGQLANFYINGTLSGTANQDLVQTISTITTTNKIRIGAESFSTTRCYNGSIRSVKMWNRVLTTAEIAQDYAGDLVSSGLIHNFKLGGDYADYGSVGVTATNSGSLPQIVEDNVAVVLKAQRTTAQLSGAYMICNVGNQILSTAISG